MKEFILTTPEDLEEIVQAAIKKVLPVKEEARPEKNPDTCSFEQALAFLSENGFKLSKSKLYKMTAGKEVPFRYFGRRIIFSRDELLAWVKRQTIPGSNASGTLLALAESARRKSNY